MVQHTSSGRKHFLFFAKRTPPIVILVCLAVVSRVAADDEALKTIQTATSDANELIAAADKLGKLRIAEAAEPLSSLLKHKNEHVRDEALLALIRIGKPSVPKLVKLVGDANEMPGTVPDSLKQHKYPDFVQSRSPLGWRQLSYGRLYGPVGRHVNRYAVRALGLIGDRDALEAIDEAEAQFGGNRWIRDECRRARIAILGKDTPVAAGMRPWMLAEIGKLDSAESMAASIARNLRKNTNNNVAQKLGPYTDIGGNAADEIRRIDVLGVLGGSKAPAPLLRLVEEGVQNDWTWFHAGMHDLVDHYHGLGVGWDGHWMGVLGSCRALGEGGAKGAIAPLKKRLNDKNILVRITAARALAQLGDDSGLQTALDDMRWMHVEFVSEYGKKGKPWLQHWLNDDQTKLANENKFPGRTWFRQVPSYHHFIAYETLAYIDSDKAKSALKKRTREILALRGSESFSEYYQTDLLWLAVALNRAGEKNLAKQALDGGMELFEGDRAVSVSLRHFHVAALPALAKINDPSTLDAVCRVLAHHQTTWRPGAYDIRDLAWGVYLTLNGRRDPNKPLRCSELCWLH